MSPHRHGYDGKRTRQVSEIHVKSHKKIVVSFGHSFRIVEDGPILIGECVRLRLDNGHVTATLIFLSLVCVSKTISTSLSSSSSSSTTGADVESIVGGDDLESLFLFIVLVVIERLANEYDGA